MVDGGRRLTRLARRSSRDRPAVQTGAVVRCALAITTADAAGDGAPLAPCLPGRHSSDDEYRIGMRDGDDRRDLNPRPALRRSAINGTPPMALPTELRPSHQRAGLHSGLPCFRDPRVRLIWSGRNSSGRMRLLIRSCACTRLVPDCVSRSTPPLM